jgi:hypothetical protein
LEQDLDAKYYDLCFYLELDDYDIDHGFNHGDDHDFAYNDAGACGNYISATYTFYYIKCYARVEFDAVESVKLDVGLRIARWVFEHYNNFGSIFVDSDGGFVDAAFWTLYTQSSYVCHEP